MELIKIDNIKVVINATIKEYLDFIDIDYSSLPITLFTKSSKRLEDLFNTIKEYEDYYNLEDGFFEYILLYNLNELRVQHNRDYDQIYFEFKSKDGKEIKYFGTNKRNINLEKGE